MDEQIFEIDDKKYKIILSHKNNFIFNECFKVKIFEIENSKVEKIFNISIYAGYSETIYNNLYSYYDISYRVEYSNDENYNKFLKKLLKDCIYEVEDSLIRKERLNSRISK